MIRALALSLAFAAAGPALAVTPERIMGYLDACAAALISGDESGFAALEVETSVTNDLTLIRGWRGAEHQGLAVSLLIRSEGESRLGICDVAFTPHPATAVQDQAALPGIAVAAREMMAGLRADPKNRPDPRAPAKVMMTCRGAQGLGVYVDEANLEHGFNAQMTLVSAKRMECAG